MDNFDLRKYLAENKLIKETKEEDYYNLLMDLKGTELDYITERTFETLMQKRRMYDSFEDFLDDEIDFFQEEGNVEIVNKIKSTFLNENKILKEEMSLEIDDDFIELTADSGTYDAYIEDDGTVDFSVTYEDEEDRDYMEFDEDNWKDILGPNHAFVKISNQIPTKVEAVDDYVMVTVDVEDLKGIANLSENKLLKEFVGKELEDRNEPLYDKLVPGNGDAETVEGEMLRAINRIVYRFYNDGDKYFEGYGTETAGPAHSFLVNANHPLKSAMIKLFDEPSGDNSYERMLKDVLDMILDYIESRQGKYTKNTLGGMFNYEPEFEEEEDDYDDYDYDYDYDDEDDY